MRLPASARDDAVAGVRAEQIDALQMVAELQVGHAGVRDALLPAHLELPELGQMAQHFEPAVGDPAAAETRSDRAPAAGTGVPGASDRRRSAASMPPRLSRVM